MKVRYIAVLLTAATFLLMATSSAHAQYSGPWTYQWNFDNTPTGFTPPFSINSSSAPGNFFNVKQSSGSTGGWNSDTVTGSAALYFLSNAWADFNVPVAFQKNQFVFTTEISWYGNNDRLRNMGIAARRIVSDDDTTQAGEWENSYDGNNSTGSSRINGLDNISTNINFGTSGGTTFDNLVGGGSSNLPTGNDNNGHFQVMLEYNLNGNGLVKWWYRALVRDTDDNHATNNGNVAWNNTVRGGTSGTWFLVNSLSIINGAQNVNQFRIGGRPSGSVGETNFDNVSIWIVPEPSSFILVGLAIPAVGALVWRRRRAA